MVLDQAYAVLPCIIDIGLDVLNTPENDPHKKALVFVQSPKTVEIVAMLLGWLGIDVSVLRSTEKQDAR